MNLNRRAFLRAASLSLPLPWLASLPSYAATSGKRVVATGTKAGPPRRFGCVYFSNGVEPQHWWAKGSGDAMELGPCLSPLEPHKREIVFTRGLFNAQAFEHKSPHLGRIPNLLSGSWVSTDQNELRAGRTMDQVLADVLGPQTDIPSLVLGIEPTELRLEDGLSMIYGSCISWASPTKPATKEIYPSRVFDLLVGSAQGRALDRSILDQVAQDALSLETRLSRADRVKLDEYLQSIRGIERRINNAAREKQDGKSDRWRPAMGQPTLARPKDGLPNNPPDHMKLMLDLMVLAFRMDKTRIATLMLNNDLSQMNFGFLSGVSGSLHLDLTHNGHDPVREAMYLKTNQFHMAQFAYLLARLAEIDEGGQSLLSNTMLMFCSNLLDGDKHQADQMPILLAGGGLRGGRVLDYLTKGDANRRACSLYLSLMDRMGVELPRFGDADRRLEGLA